MAQENAARGKHVAGFVADESCQEDPRVGRVLQAAVQGALSEPNFTIVLLSTFHVPFGFFQENWDLAVERGFARYRWDVYDCMATCQMGMDQATDTDPQALLYCQRECPLTETVPDRDAQGQIIGEHCEGCGGRARRGIDRGRFAVAVLAERAQDCVAISEGRIFDSKTIADLVQYLVELRSRVGDFVVYGDAENAYGNLDCRNAGFEVVQVPFNKMKDGGIENLASYLGHSKIRIADDGHLKTVIRQLLRCRRSEAGRILKQDDHGPDALMCAMLHFPFIDEFDTALGQLLSGTDRERLKVTNALLDACIHDYPQEMPEGGTCSMGVSMGTPGSTAWSPGSLSTKTAAFWSPGGRCSSARSRIGATWTR